MQIKPSPLLRKICNKLPQPDEIGLVSGRVLPDSEIYQQIAAHANAVVNGILFCVDPSIGSGSSQPGYAIYILGKLRECGVIDVARVGTHSSRLYAIGTCLREEFFTGVDPSLLILEKIPVSFFGNKRGKQYSAAAKQVPLHRASGAVLASVRADNCVEIAPNTWHRFVDEKKYKKSDMNDAIAMGHAVICMATHYLESRK